MIKVKFITTLSVLTAGVMLVMGYSNCKSDREPEIKPVRVVVDDAFLQLIGLPMNSIEKKMDSVIAKDTHLSNLISNYMLGVKDSVEKGIHFQIYFNDSSRTRLKDSCIHVFQQFDWQKSLGIPFALYQQAFPQRNIPVIHLLITDFNYGIFVFQDDQNQDAIGIGEEMFLGNTLLYDQLSLNNPNFSSYINRSFNLQHLPSKIIQAMIGDLLPTSTSNRMLDRILLEGKKLYITKKLIPGIQDTILHEYSRNQWEWVKENEIDIWRFLLADKLLYQSGEKNIVNLVEPSPHSQGMPPQAPGRAVNYIGMRIIESLVKKEGLSLNALVELQNGEEILRRAGYKPR